MQGIFYGQAIGQALLTIFYFNICYNIDWEVQVEEIRLQNNFYTETTPSYRGSQMTNPQKYDNDDEKVGLLERAEKGGNGTILTGAAYCQTCTNKERLSHLSF